MVGGSGGAGATTFACALGQLAARARAARWSSTPTRSGPGVDRVLGLEDRDGVRWDGLCQTTGRLSARSLREALPRREGLGGADLARRARRAASRRSPCARCSRRPSAATTSWSSTCRAPRDPLVDEVVARCDRLLVVVVPDRRRGRVGGPALRAARRPDAGCGWCVRGGGVDPQAIARATGVPVLAADGRPARPRRVDRPRARAGALPARRRSAGPPPRCSTSSRCCTRRRRERRTAGAPRPRGGPRPAGPRRPGSSPRTGWPRRCARPAGRSATPRCSPSTRRCAATWSAPGRSSRCCARPGVTDVLVNGAGPGLPRPRRRARAHRRPVPRRGGGAPAGPAAGRARRAPARRRDAVRRPAAARRHPLPRRARAARPARHADLAAGAAARGPSPSTSWSRAGTLDAGRRAELLDAIVARPAGLPGQRRHRLRQDHAARGAARRGSRPDERLVAGRGRQRAAPRPPARRRRSRAGRPTSRAPARSTLRTLVRQALRMRPDRLVVGEVRGGEVVDLLAALNTGHEGGCGTLHANSALDVPARVEALALAAGLGRGGRAQPARLRRRRRRCTWPADRDGVRRLAPGRGARRAAPTAWSRWRRRSTSTRDGAADARAGGRAGSPTGSAPMTAAGRGRAAAALAVLLLVRPPRPPSARPARRASPAGPLPAVAGAARWLVARRRARGPARCCSWSPGPRAAGVGAGPAPAARAGRPRRSSARVLETCELLAGELAAGQPPGECLDRAAAAWPPLAPVAEAFRVGADVPAALRELAAELDGAGDLRVVAAAWQVAHRTGRGAGRDGRPGRRVAARRRRPPGGWSRASWPRRGRPPGWSPACRCWPWRWARAPAATRGASCSAPRRAWPAWRGGLAFGLAGLWWIEAIARDAEDVA